MRRATSLGATTLTLAAVLLAGAGQASAATFTVDTTQDGQDMPVGDGECQTPGGDCTLRADRLNGGAGKDKCKGGGGNDRVRGCEKGDSARAATRRRRAVELDLRARKRNTLRRLSVKASCFSGPCELRVAGAVVAGDRRFAIRPRDRAIRPNEIHKLGLRLRRRGAGEKVRELLDGGAKPTARIRAEATGPDGSTDTATAAVKIRKRRDLKL